MKEATHKRNEMKEMMLTNEIKAIENDEKIHINTHTNSQTV